MFHGISTFCETLTAAHRIFTIDSLLITALFFKHIRRSLDFDSVFAVPAVEQAQFGFISVAVFR